MSIPVASEIDVYTNRVKIYVKDRARFDDAIVDGKLRVPACVDVVTVESLGTLDTDIYGGLALTTCTSGYAVKTAGGTKGITTSGHVEAEQSYGGHNLPLQDEEYATSYDIQWHTAPDFTVVNKIQWYTGYVCDINFTKSRSEQSIGGWVAKYGKTTEFTAGHISSKTYQPPNPEDATATYIRVDNDGGYEDLSQSGDSGGPWFNNHTAYGSHCGSVAGDMDDVDCTPMSGQIGLGGSGGVGSHSAE
ncbi:MAG: hypothetical protein Q7T57_04005 [Dehalococcoidales bacterium]|nr:hypothetical protein [Dehalococcoidales bacterium]